MKVAYISSSCFSDVDLSYISSAQEYSNIHYFLNISPYSIRDIAVNLNEFKKCNGVFKAYDLYPELRKFNKIIDGSKFYVVNTTGTRFFHLSVVWTNVLLLLFLIKKKYKVLHITHFLYWNQWILFLLKKRMILTVHDPIPHSTDSSNLMEKRRRFDLKFIKNILLLNKNQREAFIERYNLEHYNIYQSFLGPYNYLHMYDTEESSFKDYVLFFGRINKYKGIEYLLEAMTIVHIKNPDIKLIVAGSGEMYFDTEKYKHLDYISFFNRFIPDDELASLIRNCKYVVCPYIDATQSGVIMSAYAYSKPVIATNVGGLPEMVENGINGLIVEPKDKKSLAEAMIRLLDQSLLDKFSKAISNKYQEGEFSWLGISKELSNVYNEIAK